MNKTLHLCCVLGKYHLFPVCLYLHTGSGETAQQLRALDALSEDTEESSSRRSDAFSSPPQAAHTWYTDIHTTFIHIKQ